MSKRKTTKEFIKESEEKFGEGKFGYANTVYINNHTDIIITCPKHGDFKVRPSNHLRKGSNGGCDKCKKEYMRQLLSSNTEEFIRRSEEKFGEGKFGYANTVYTNNRTKLIITCPKHGDFKTLPDNHLHEGSNGGCKECMKEHLRELKASNTKEFIEKSKKLHGNKFSYNRTIYVNNHTDIIITCNKHGDFKIRPDVHLNGCGGCPKCKSSKLEDEVRKLLTENKFRFEEQKPFSWLIGPGGKPQTLDFYLTDLGIGIECQGGQHFYAIDLFGGEEGLKDTQERDQNKLKLCEEHGIKLMYYSNLSTSDKPFDYPYPVYEDGAKLIEKLMSMLDNDTDAEDTAQN